MKTKLGLVRGALAGKAHAAIYPQAKKAAALFQHDLSTEYRWRLSGPPHLTRYLLQAPNQWRLWAHMRVQEQAREQIDGLPRPQLFERFRALQAEFGVTLAQTMDMGAREIDRAQADEKLAALAAERAAIRERFEAEGLTEADVWRGRVR